MQLFFWKILWLLLRSNCSSAVSETCFLQLSQNPPILRIPTVIKSFVSLGTWAARRMRIHRQHLAESSYCVHVLAMTPWQLPDSSWPQQGSLASSCSSSHRALFLSAKSCGRGVGPVSSVVFGEGRAMGGSLSGRREEGGEWAGAEPAASFPLDKLLFLLKCLWLLPR